jgi:lincosamide nucleotidyltransferase A/C/D/E
MSLLDQEGVRAWLDGGWAVDALLGRQTRLHSDLDLAVVAGTRRNQGAERRGITGHR